MGREVRRVPLEWQHPRDDRGNFRPLLETTPMQYAECRRQWEAGFVKGYGEIEWEARRDSGTTFEEWYGDATDDERMPDFPDGAELGYCMYETCTEGTPISPVFETPEQLARWLADTKASAFAGQPASYKGWLRVARSGFAPSMVMSGGVTRSGVDGVS